ncbi:MAG: alpha-ketoglutarate-dependent dioxygenase AlkB [Leptospiraceae bacterium]|nr:alpha-ketoglutarate-dependent dioxygenase AlkB [Leptospiraceae bacterium]MCP5510551.1 alpha-ketoglutarate-dependent dioxygenase AlkB [Leptospiraceae bacterium]
MDSLFSKNHSNLLPADGCVIYYGKIFSDPISELYLKKLLESLPWQKDRLKLYNREIITDRKSVWMGEDSFTYTYSGYSRTAIPFTEEIIKIKKLIEHKTNIHFNSCLCNLYHDGREGMSFHSDDEKELGKNTSIASVSFGAERKFVFKHKITAEKISILLERGSLLLMKDETQSFWLHSLPKASKVIIPRINLTFRTFYGMPPDRSKSAG